MAITLLRSLGLPEKIVGLMKELYTVTQLASSVWKELFLIGSRSETESGKVVRLHYHISCFLCIRSLNAQHTKALQVLVYSLMKCLLTWISRMMLL